MYKCLLFKRWKTKPSKLSRHQSHRAQEKIPRAGKPLTPTEHVKFDKKTSTIEFLRIEFAWCGNCSHTLWEYFAHYDAFPSAI